MTAFTAGLGRVMGRADPAVAALVIIPVALALTLPEQAAESLRFTAASLLGVAPFLLLSVAVAAYAKASGAEHLIARAFQGHVVPMVVAASLMGALSPFCSCGVIPLIAALLALGVPLAPVMAFWLASPIMDPSMFVMTAGTLGVDFAIAKTVAAIGIGLLGGFGTLLLTRLPAFAEPLRPGVGNGGCAGAKIRAPKPVVWAFWSDALRRTQFIGSARDTALFLGKWLALAFLLESLMLAYVPAEVVAQAVGGSGVVPVLSAALVGVPAYLNGYAALPLVSGLLGQGMAPGAAMSFLVAGGVTSIPAAIAVFALARLPVFAAYIAFSLSGAIIAGLAWSLLA